MKLLRILIAMIFLATPFGLSGCGGGGAQIQQNNQTLGQELKDLDEAYKQGLMSEKEYKKIRKELIDRYTD